MTITPETIQATFRSPYLPGALRELAAVEGYLDHLWPALQTSIETQGFLDSARYMADMALAAVEEVYEPVMRREDVLAAGLSETDLDQLSAVLDVFHYIQPQVLLLCAALAEGYERASVGGQGRSEPRPLTEREQRLQATTIALAPPGEPPLPAVAAILGLPEAPEVFRAAAHWPPYVNLAWEELQHLPAYPQFRRRGRGLYYYARSGARFLAREIEANPGALRAAGLTEEAIVQAGDVLDRSVPAFAMLLMHTEALRTTLGIHDREVVQR